MFLIQHFDRRLTFSPYIFIVNYNIGVACRTNVQTGIQPCEIELVLALR